MDDAPAEPSEYDRAIDPYFTAIGKVSSSWNRLQDALAMLFVAFLDPLPNATPLGIWYTVKSDRGQREMLKAAAAARFHYDDKLSRFPSGLADINWLLNRIESLEDQRNNALHAPLGIGADFTERKLKMVPWTAMSHPRAERLVGKELLKEFDWYTATAQALSGFAYKMHAAIVFYQVGDKSFAWPEKPQLPHLGQSQTDE